MEIPSKVSACGLESWYSGLSDTDRIKINRYLDKADSSSTFSFFLSTVKASMADENYRFALALCVATSNLPFDAYQRFLINEEMIDVLMERNLFEDAKNVCSINKELFPQVKDMILKDNNGKYPERLAFRNRYFDILVGVESRYDDAFKALEEYHTMGLISAEDLEYRKNSLRIHRMQKTFDGIYTYRPKGECDR